MKLKSKILTLVAMLAFAPTVAWAATPGAGLEGTSHDFSGKVASTGFTTGSCTFCHTPHKALATLLLWNHTLSTSTFTWDETKTTAGTPFATIKGDTYKGPTAKCLSCHDGTVAIGDIAWFGEAKPTVVDATMHTSGEFNIAAGAAAGNMKGNHPVAMPYPFNNAKNTYNLSTTGAGATLTEWVADPTTSNNIRLFNDTGGVITAGTAAGTTGMECSSCHDPHNKAAKDDLFLRGKMSGKSQADGYLCLQCHIK